MIILKAPQLRPIGKRRAVKHEGIHRPGHVSITFLHLLPPHFRWPVYPFLHIADWNMFKSLSEFAQRGIDLWRLRLIAFRLFRGFLGLW